ncbi:nucleoside deaminase [Salinicola aestuarinus]|uniref:nucleoside deaminase n=1 Tax=Salinicola aestuarinus TaxID=1949082 RepID=UPI000DA25C97|nr:nucleoside deaminase [Salinicola aestuarinus]
MSDESPTIKANEKRHLERAISLAEAALQAGDEPFGSVLVGADGRVLAEARNRINTGEATRHPEFALSRWAADNLEPAARAVATVYTSGEHCPMCAAAHGWAGLGRIVYASSAAQLTQWLAEFGVDPAPVAMLSIRDVLPSADVIGPIEGYDQRVYALHRRCHTG